MSARQAGPNGVLSVAKSVSTGAGAAGGAGVPRALKKQRIVSSFRLCFLIFHFPFHLSWVVVHFSSFIDP